MISYRNIIAILFLFTGLFSYAFIHQSNVRENHTLFSGMSDSAFGKFQNCIDSLYDKIAVYAGDIYDKAESEQRLKELKIQQARIEDTLVKLNAYDLQEICGAIPVKNNEQKVREKLKGIYRNIDLQEQEKINAAAKIIAEDSFIKVVDKRINKNEKEYNKAVEEVNKLASGVGIPGRIFVNKVYYRFFIANITTDKIQIHHNPFVNRGQTFNYLMDRLSKEKEEVAMLMNGGMYTPSFGAQGLLIENFKEFSKLDTLQPDNNLNFYMQPNGVFYIDSTGYTITRTEDYKLNRNKKGLVPKFATQSGPMLITGGQRNSKFKKGSTNYYIRNGVGLIDKSKVVFIISEKPVNFYDFAFVFKEIFGCKNALYLDGAISEMYINEKLSSIKNSNTNNGSFGPIISVSKIKK